MLFFASLLPYLDTETNPFRKLKELLKFDFNILNGLTWLVVIFMIVLTLGVIVLLFWIVWDIVRFLINVRRAKADFKDKKFYIELAGTVLLIWLLVSGVLFDIFANIYDWSNSLNIGKESAPTTMLEYDRYSDFFG